MPSRLTQEDFVKKALLVHPSNDVDYSLVTYVNTSTKVDLRCKKEDHGIFTQLPSNHLKGVGCPKCANVARSESKSLDTNSFIDKAILVHNNKYGYSNIDYKGYNEMVVITCPIHGEFQQRANNHLAGIGCSKCGRSLTKNKLSKTYKPSNNSKLKFREVPPKTRNKRVLACHCGRETIQSGYQVEKGIVITCGSCLSLPKSHWLSQKWGHLTLNKDQNLLDEWPSLSHKKYLFDCDCGKSSSIMMSSVTKEGGTKSCGCLIPGKSEYSPVREVEAYLISLGVLFYPDDRKEINPYELDVWIPSHNLAIEFNGTYYHSLDGTEPPSAKMKHLKKFKLCEERGILLLQINEHEWNNPITQTVWKSIISSKLGFHTKISARKTTFKIIENSLANGFLEVNHLQGNTPNIRWSFGIYYLGDLVGVLVYCKHQNNQINLSRLAFKLNTTVVGGAKKLFKNSLEYLPKQGIISFSNNQYSNGSVYKTLGFIKQIDLKPSYQWVFRGKIWNKRRLRRKALEKTLLLDKFDPLETEHENLYRNGARCLYDAGYKKWTFSRER